MEWLRISTSTELVRVAADEIVYVRADGNYSDLVLTNGKSRKIRQFILVSDGAIPSRFFLHGKVESRAIGRIGDQLYFIATRHKETLWDFADALREYGFIDAIYITGGTDHCYCRNKAGNRHDIGDTSDYPHTKWKGIVPWLVFKKVDYY